MGQQKTLLCMAGGVVCLRMCAQNTHAQRLEAVEVKWQGCRPSRTTTKTNSTPRNMSFLFSVGPKAISLWFMAYSAQCRNILHFLYKEPMGICCTFYSAVVFTDCTLSIVHSFTAFCIYTFQWRQSATKPVIVEVTSAHSQLQRARASQEDMHVWVCVCV